MYRRIIKLTGIFLLLMATVTLAGSQAALATNPPSEESAGLLKHSDERKLEKTFGKRCRRIVVDSNMSYKEALGDDVVPAQYTELHAKMKPYLRVLTVYYKGYDDCLHRGQIVVHKALVGDTLQQFWKMLRYEFPIYSVIPHSKFNYNDEVAMAANNTSNYRPERLSSGNLSEHAKGAAFDINPVQNPFIIPNDDGTTTVQPAGAVYDPSAKGTILKGSPVQLSWSEANYEWGGSWGDPNADPPRDFFLVGFYDYQHFQPRPEKLSALPLPEDL